MNSMIDELSRAVLHRPLEECSIDELQRITSEFPYFGPAHLLLAKKLSSDLPANSTNYKEQVQKTSLYFPNRVWLDHLLNGYNGDEQAAIEKQHDEAVAATSTSSFEEPATNNETSITSETIAELPQVVTTVPVNDTIQNLSPTESLESIDHSNPEIEPAPIETETSTTSQPAVIEPGESAEEAALVFEPYHTVDYFASQGIKLREEEKPKDRFSEQLKSFTEWLKTLKRVSATEMVTPADPGSEKNVEQMAEFSIAERHVITEAMAEVWKKQGNKVKAEDIYRKLSLLDPSKSSYFAAKIEELKKTS